MVEFIQAIQQLSPMAQVAAVLMAGAVPITFIYMLFSWYKSL